MTQRDTPRQKEIILELIDACDGLIESGWDDTVFESKEAAKKYILEYGTRI